MNMYKISCYSSCGTYFTSYLQSVTVLAESRLGAVSACKDWLQQEGKSFIEKDENKWLVTLVSRNVPCGVIDWFEDSDY